MVKNYGTTCKIFISTNKFTKEHFDSFNKNELDDDKKQEQIQNTLYQAHYVKVKDNNDAVVLFFQPIFDFIDQLLCNGKHVLIHCLAGAHRAGTTAIAYLMYKKKISLQKAIVLAKLRRSVIDPVGSFPALLIRLELGLSTRKKNDAKKLFKI